MTRGEERRSVRRARVSSDIGILRLIMETQGKSRRVLEALASNSHCDAELLDKVAESGMDSVLLLLARNPSSGGRLLRRLYDVPGKKYHCALASNPGCPVSLLRRMAVESEPWYVKRRLCGNPRLADDVLERLKGNHCPEVSAVAAGIGDDRSGGGHEVIVAASAPSGTSVLDVRVEPTLPSLVARMSYNRGHAVMLLCGRDGATGGRGDVEEAVKCLLMELSAL